MSGWCKDCFHKDVCKHKEEWGQGVCAYQIDKDRVLVSRFPIGKKVYGVETRDVQTSVEIDGKKYWTYKPKVYVTVNNWSWEDECVYHNKTDKFFTNHDDAIAEKKRLEEVNEE